MTDPLIPSPALEGLMKKAFVEGTMAPGLFWDALLKSDLFVPLSEKQKKGEAKEEPDKEIQEIPLLLGVDSKGRRVIWLFTSVETMIEYTEQDLPYLKMQAQTLFSRLLETEKDIVLIGPGMLTLELHKDLVGSFAQGVVPEAPEESVRYVPKDVEIRVGPPRESEALQKRLKELFKTRPDVLEASFLQIADDSGSRLLLGLRLEHDSRENLKSVADAVAQAAHGVLEKGKTMDITLINGSLLEAFEKWGKTFYEK